MLKRVTIQNSKKNDVTKIILKNSNNNRSFFYIGYAYCIAYCQD